MAHDHGIDLILCKLDRLSDLFARGHRAQMEKIDADTNALAAQIEEIAAGANAEQAGRLRSLAASLNAIGKPTPDEGT